MEPALHADGAKALAGQPADSAPRVVETDKLLAEQHLQAIIEEYETSQEEIKNAVNRQRRPYRLLPAVVVYSKAKSESPSVPKRRI